MESDLPYLIAPKRFPDFLAKLQLAAVPERVSFEFLKKLGFSSSNDRAYPSLLKRLGFLDPNGQPTDRYRAYRQKPLAKRVLAEGVRELYSELFALHMDVCSEDREAIAGLVSRVTGREQKYVELITTTFQMLCDHSDFTPAPEPKKDPPPAKTTEEDKVDDKKKDDKKEDKKGSGVSQADVAKRPLTFAYNIQIHLPATTDIGVYNAIFKSLKDHLGD